MRRLSAANTLTLLLICGGFLDGPATQRCTAAGAGPSSGNALLRKVLATLESAPSLSCGVRYQALLEGDKLLGTGQFMQRGTGSQRVSRMQVQSKVAGQTASLEQVFDGDFLWTDTRLPSGRTVRRTDVRRAVGTVLSTLPGQDSDSPYRPHPLVETALVRGGVSQLVADLLTSFDFGPPQAGRHGGEPVWAMVGTWKPAGLEDALGPTEGNAPAWPGVMPHHVLVLVGRDDHLPRMIEFRRESDGPLNKSPAAAEPCQEPLVRLELLDIRLGAALADGLFRYYPGEAQVVDDTHEAIARLEALGGRDNN